jgi:ribose/xylose/arabinose/galactoside ABC-type transport system permease subunit
MRGSVFASAARLRSALAPRTLALPRVFKACATVALVMVVAYGAFTTEGFATVANGKAILAAMAVVGIVAVGMTLIVLSGNLFSLSLGTTVAVSAMFFLYALRFGVPTAITLTLLLGIFVSAIQGLIIGGWGANPIIVTIGAAAVQEGLAIRITGGRSVFPPEGDASYEFLSEPVLGLPFAIYVLFVVAVLAELMLRRARFGRQMYLVGENKPAARAAGLSMARVATGVFALAGLCAAVAGVLVGASSGHGELLLGGTYTYDAFAAAIVGGNAIAGGRGSVARTMIGALIIATISDMLLLRGYSTGAQVLVKGAIVLVVVILVHLGTARTTG